MGGANSSTIISVEVLVKVNVFAKMRVLLEPLVLTEKQDAGLSRFA